MRNWDLFTSAARLRKATEDLQIAWQQTTEFWQDDVSHAFCERYLEPLGPATKMSLEAIGRMRQLMNQIQRECESSDPF